MMELRKCNLDDIVWIRKGSSVGSTADISVRKCKDGCINFTFRNGALPNISKSEYVQFGILDGALLFREAGKSDGYKATFKARTGNYHLSIKNNEAILDWLSEFDGEGDYHARMFKSYLYIDSTTKIERE